MNLDLDAEFEAMKQSLKGGIQIVTAPQLFETPPDLARRMVELADIDPKHRVLEPSAGTGRIIKAIGAGPDKVAVEINGELVKRLCCAESGLHTHQADFLECGEELGKFDRVLMNPPFKNGEDIKHIKHALEFLKPGGILVAICAGGPRQKEQLESIASYWEELPPGTFKNTGTNVNTVLLTIET